MKIKKDNILIFLFCIFSAFLPLLVCSKSSFLYPFNDWPDVNIFFTVGKGMVHGLLPYVDMIDHKGPYLYLISGISYMISKTTFHGYFLFEWLSMSVFLYYVHKLSFLYTKRNALWILPFVCAAIVTAKSFVHGGSVEELCFGIYGYAIYSLMYFLHQEEKKKISNKTLVINSLLMGIIFWSKFTLLGLYIGWIIILIYIFIKQKEYKNFLKVVLFACGGIIITMVPWIVFFGIHGEIDVWLNNYIFNNIFGYTSGEDISIWKRFTIAIINTLRSLKDKGNWTYSIWVIFGCVGYLFMPSKKVLWIEKTAVFLMGLFMALGIFIGGTKHDYYGLPLAAFSMYATILVGFLVNNIIDKIKKKKTEKKKTKSMLVKLVLYCICFILVIIKCYFVSPNSYMLHVQTDEMPQYRFAKHISESTDQSLLNYAFLDGGFFTVLDIDPTVKYYCITNIDRSFMLQEQNKYVEEQRTHWLVTWKAMEVSEEELKEMPIVSDYYELIDYQYFYFEGASRTYALYEVKD